MAELCKTLEWIYTWGTDWHWFHLMAVLPSLLINQDSKTGVSDLQAPRLNFFSFRRCRGKISEALTRPGIRLQSPSISTFLVCILQDKSWGKSRFFPTSPVSHQANRSENKLVSICIACNHHIKLTEKNRLTRICASGILKQASEIIWRDP